MSAKIWNLDCFAKRALLKQNQDKNADNVSFLSYKWIMYDL